MEEIQTKRRAGRPARAGERMKVASVSLPRIVLDVLEEDFGGKNAAEQVRSALFQYLASRPQTPDLDRLRRRIAAMQKLVLVSIGVSEDSADIDTPTIVGSLDGARQMYADLDGFADFIAAKYARLAEAERPIPGQSPPDEIASLKAMLADQKATLDDVRRNLDYWDAHLPKLRRELAEQRRELNYWDKKIAKTTIGLARLEALIQRNEREASNATEPLAEGALMS